MTERGRPRAHTGPDSLVRQAASGRAWANAGPRRRRAGSLGRRQRSQWRTTSGAHPRTGSQTGRASPRADPPPSAGWSRSGIVSDDTAGTLARMFEALRDPSRVRLLSMIAAASENGACACDKTEPVGLSQPTLSHHPKGPGRRRPWSPASSAEVGLLPRGPLRYSAHWRPGSASPKLRA